ncbi:hypothetical protein [Arthrobacter sp. ov118]|uniref:hypothetical protein n=1 Tax=Arthrobacter sp. ov118 TaxID=1761747 RepID=UPI0008EE3CDF|nr:hypothetical protein [Arthrobacter sp. ov118]SFT76207.1 hypothetical protein SAMN04487915_103100 [Arthrobacter sp. ov118]
MYESKEQNHRPVIDGGGESADPARASGLGIDRRRVLGSGLAMAATAGLLAGVAPRASAAAPGEGGAFQEVSGHALYLLPQDHKWHTGGIYDTGHFQEWHYWTGFFTDDDTGEKFGIFYNITNNPSAPGGPRCGSKASASRSGTSPSRS